MKPSAISPAEIHLRGQSDCVPLRALYLKVSRGRVYVEVVFLFVKVTIFCDRSAMFRVRRLRSR